MMDDSMEHSVKCVVGETVVLEKTCSSVALSTINLTTLFGLEPGQPLRDPND
jgi:hypothetical protein